MICPECGKQVKGYVCYPCQAVRTYKGMILHQRRFLETWLEGTIDLRIKRINGTLHLELFDDRWHAYCGKEMFSVTDREYMKELPPELCPACYEVFQQIRNQVMNETRDRDRQS
jgi:hypothetical protein